MKGGYQMMKHLIFSVILMKWILMNQLNHFSVLTMMNSQPMLKERHGLWLLNGGMKVGLTHAARRDCQ